MASLFLTAYVTTSSWPTVLGVIAFYAYPPLILIYDGFMKFVMKDETISEWTWQSPAARVAACLYMATWAILLTLHLGFMFLPG